MTASIRQNKKDLIKLISADRNLHTAKGKKRQRHSTY